MSWIFALWSAAVVLVGSVLMSYHQPFRSPSGNILSALKNPNHRSWTAIHLVSASCGCSQRVMAHLLARGTDDDLAEQILVIDGHEPDLPGSALLLARLERAGFATTHVDAENIPQDWGVHGVPLLVLASSDGKLAYTGGYGTSGDQESEILRQMRSGRTPASLPIVGCALGDRLKRRADPFRLKYGANP